MICLQPYNCVILTFGSREAASDALDKLVLGGFPLAQVFIAGKDLESNRLNSTNRELVHVGLPDIGGITGTALGLTKGWMIGNMSGGISGIGLGLGMLALPSIGYIALSSAMILVLLSGSIGIITGGLIGAFIGLGMTEIQVKRSQFLIEQGYYLLFVTGTKTELEWSQKIMTSYSKAI